MMNLFKSYTVYEELVTFIEFLRRQLYIIVVQLSR